MATKKYGKWICEDNVSEGGQAHTFITYAEDDEQKTQFVLKRLKNINRVGRFINKLGGYKYDVS